MIAAQTPGLWQSQLASFAVKMSSDQSPDNCAGPGMDAVTLQKALLQQQQAFQLQLQNILMLQQSGLNSALNLSSTNPLLSLDLSKGPLKTRSRSPSPNLKEEVDDTKMMQVVYSLPACRPPSNNLIYCIFSLVRVLLRRKIYWSIHWCGRIPSINHLIMEDFQDPQCLFPLHFPHSPPPHPDCRGIRDPRHRW